MGYSYGDSKGWLAPGPNIGGAHALMSYLRKNVEAGDYPELRNLLTEGESIRPMVLKGEALRLAKKTTDEDVKDTLLRLARAAAKATGYLMVTH
jgi:hypothetical protein